MRVLAAKRMACRGVLIAISVDGRVQLPPVIQLPLIIDLLVASYCIAVVPDLSALAPALEIIISGIFTGKVIKPVLQDNFCISG